MKNDTNEIIDGIITCFLGELMGHSCLIEMNITLVAWICLLVKESTYDKGNIIHSGFFQPSAPTILRNGHLHMLLSSFCTSQSPSHYYFEFRAHHSLQILCIFFQPLSLPIHL